MEIVIRASVIFFFLLLLTRGMKKRTLADMAPFEMLLLVTLGDIVQQGVTQEDFSLTGCDPRREHVRVLDHRALVAHLAVAAVGRIVDGVPVVLVQDGEPVDAVMAAERMPLDELHEAARQEGIDDLAKVRRGRARAERPDLVHQDRALTARLGDRLLERRVGELGAVELGVAAAFAEEAQVVPCSTMRPSSTTRMASAALMVDSRWAITMAVRSVSAAASASCTATSDSRVEVGGGLVEDHDAAAGRAAGGRW